MKLAFDLTLRRPACVLLQSILGGDSRLANCFPTETWLVGPTPDLHVYEITPEQLLKLADLLGAPRRYAKLVLDEIQGAGGQP